MNKYCSMCGCTVRLLDADDNCPKCNKADPEEWFDYHNSATISFPQAVSRQERRDFVRQALETVE